jgi:glutamate/tyrosine decarboxylase-like PLP-dependent enzyme
MDVTAARELLAARPERDLFCVVATAGTTSTGAVDPLPPLADLAAERGAWFHVDGAYGYAYRLVPAWAPLFAGHDRADSISWDPHKQLGAPIPSSLLFVRDGDEFRRMALYSDYFNRREDPVPNPGLKSPPSTRPLAALPVVTILRGKGMRRVVQELRAPLVAMRELAVALRAMPDVRVEHRPDTGILCFRVLPPGLAGEKADALQKWLCENILASGVRTISTTALDDRVVLRVAVVAPHVTTADLLHTVQMARRLARERS